MKRQGDLGQTESAVEPVTRNLIEPVVDKPRSGIGLCLSGGGYRAMLFHLGALWRLNELGYLPKLDRISSVSGGSITAGVLGANWSNLRFNAVGVAQNFTELIVAPLREIGMKTLDVPAVLLGLFLPGGPARRLTSAYDRHLFAGSTLQDFPGRPRFVINATNVQSGVLWRFSKPYMRDYRVGEVKNPIVPLATAVAASSAFPPVLSPLVLNLRGFAFTPLTGTDLQKEPYVTNAVLTDGGVYDNLGLETVWKEFDTVLVSDGGGQMEPQSKPHRDWVLHSVRVLNIIDNQVRSLRKRQVIDSFKLGVRKGTYWGIRTNIADYQLENAMVCPVDRTRGLASLSTRLRSTGQSLQERLINWGYAVCDAGMRRHVDAALPAPIRFPYHTVGV